VNGDFFFVGVREVKEQDRKKEREMGRKAGRGNLGR
jgi:hypothetical protein